jgi:dCTP deaminase
VGQAGRDGYVTMSLLSYTELCELQTQGVIRGSLPEHVNATSIDVTLGAELLVERHGMLNVVSLRGREALRMKSVNLLRQESYVVQPGEFLLAQSTQSFYLPDDLSCEYKLKSSMARIGLEHMNAGWCDAGWNGSVLTLELQNVTHHHAIRLQLGDRIGQVVFFRHLKVPEEASYRSRGRYNGDLTVKGVKL